MTFNAKAYIMTINLISNSPFVVRHNPKYVISNGQYKYCDEEIIKSKTYKKYRKNSNRLYNSIFMYMCMYVNYAIPYKVGMYNCISQ